MTHVLVAPLNAVCKPAVTEAPRTLYLPSDYNHSQLSMQFNCTAVLHMLGKDSGVLKCWR